MSHPTVPQSDQLPTSDTGAVDDFVDFADFYESVPNDLLFECVTTSSDVSGGVSVFRDRVVVEDIATGTPCVCELEQITSWSVTPDTPETVVVEIDQPARTHRTRLPMAFARAISVALNEVTAPTP